MDIFKNKKIKSGVSKSSGVKMSNLKKIEIWYYIGEVVFNSQNISFKVKSYTTD